MDHKKASIKESNWRIEETQEAPNHPVGIHQEAGQGQQEKSSKHKKLLWRICFLVALLVFLASAGYLLHWYLQGQEAEKAFASLKIDGSYDLEALYAQNSDIVGWLTIEDTSIDYPVVQTPSDSDYYLRRNFQKESSTAGTLFVDGSSSMVDPLSANWIIYGHNMKNGTMFHDLLDYADEEFYKTHTTFTFDTIEGIGSGGIYEVVAVCYTQVYSQDEDVFKYYKYANITSAVAFDEYVAGVKALSIYDTGVTPTWGDQLITLSTCEYSVTNGRFIVVARYVGK